MTRLFAHPPPDPLNLLILGFWTGPYLLAWTWAAWLNEVNASLEGKDLTISLQVSEVSGG